MARKKEDEIKVRVGYIASVSGEVNIAGGNIYKGFSEKQVSALLKRIASTFQTKPFDGRCPYKGLDVFEEEDVELFFGRENLVDDLISRVKQSRTIFITGPSGSGKSSLVRAGLIYELKQGIIKNSNRWLYEMIKPGRAPIEALALAFSRLKSPELSKYFRKNEGQPNILHECAESALSNRKDQRLVLFVDQFEEVFTQVSKEEERVRFLNLLTKAATVENGRVIIIFTMRSDFVPNCAIYHDLNNLLSQQFVQLGAMQSDELVSAIAQPALHAGLRIDSKLIAQIINDMQGEPGALPLMQFTLKDLFDSQQAKGGVIALTLNDYLERGGIHKSLERHADDSFLHLDKNEKELARSIFSGLIEIGRGTQDTRRTALLNELIPEDAKAADMEVVVQKLAAARLITTDEKDNKEIIMLAHEKLIDAWPWLKKLVNENRDVIALQNEIAADAIEWEDKKRDASYLYSGVRLAIAREQLQIKKLKLSGLAQKFVQAGRAQQQRTQIASIGVLSTIIILLIIAIIIFSRQSIANEELAQKNDEIAKTAQASEVIAQTNSEEAQNQAKISHAGELAAKSVALRDKDYLISMLLGVEAFHTSDSVQSRSVLADNAQINPQLKAYLSRNTSLILSVTFSPDGKTLASGTGDGTILLWDAETYQPIGQPLKGHTDWVYSVAFSPNGKTLASGGWDDTIILWDVETHQPIGQPLKGHTDWVYSVAFSPDGKTLASGGRDNTIILWDVETHQLIGQALSEHTDDVTSVAFGPDGKTLASSSYDGTVIMWDAETQQSIGQLLNDHKSWVTSVTYSSDGKTLASSSYDDTVTLWDAVTRKPLGPPLSSRLGSVTSVAFSPDGEILALGGENNTIIILDTKTKQPIGQPLSGHTEGVSKVAFSPDGKTLASCSRDNFIILWNVATGQPISRAFHGHTSEVSSVAFSPLEDRKMLASGSTDNTIILWDVATGTPTGQPLNGHTSGVTSVAFSPDGKILASGSVDHTIMLWDVTTGQPIGQPLNGHTSGVTSVAFSPDGKILASGSVDHTIMLWDVAKRQPIGLPLGEHTSEVTSVAFSPDGKMLASGSFNKTIILWNVATEEPISLRSLDADGSVTIVAFNPDGKTLAVGSNDYTIILWDVTTGQRIGHPLRAHINKVTSLAFSPDGKTLVSSSWDGTIIQWDVTTEQPIGQPLTEHSNWVTSVAYNPDGKTFASGSVDKIIILWNLDPQSLVEKFCRRAGRNFTRAEWAQYFPNEEYRVTCPQWPTGE